MSKGKERRDEVTQSCPTLCNSVDCRPPSYPVHGILQARILQWIVISFFRGSSQPKDRTQISYIASKFFTIWPTKEDLKCLKKRSEWLHLSLPCPPGKLFTPFFVFACLNSYKDCLGFRWGGKKGRVLRKAQREEGYISPHGSSSLLCDATTVNIFLTFC